ncbi:glycoside hydrolase family 32 protein [Microbacterium sp. B35-30]|uniref:glycoside hydrolase family 32 protein n=1 Tax=Microbacterium sp. B35-30 TaxID=1962642 RepID=UPI0013D4EA79|nr:glycoside hydrolase family 32 protein [Microbacterium sp. B35-30]KAF2419657.1 levanase [Microbacterium sp. B35-30]
MPEGDIPYTPRRRRSLVIAVAAALAVLAVAVVAVLAIGLPREQDTQTAPSPTAPSTGGSERPAEWSPHRPGIHITPGENWMNDPQKPFLLDGVWHYYYLYNADYPDGNGTAWYHATSTDLVHWKDEGVAIEKYANGLGDIWTGTAVVDEKGTAGFGAGAVVALVTQQVDGVQRQSLFFSRDDGYSFESYDGNPVMDNPGVADWRDPRVFWDESAGHWVMALAEHDRIGLYTSPNLREWTYTSDFATTGLGVLECPDLFPMSVDGDPDDVRWVLVAGANGAAEGMTTGTAYWVGEWDGERFVADGTGHQWLDHGPDYYAAVTWDDPRLGEEERLATRYSIGWMNNWAYAGRFPTEGWQGGSDSIVRTITLGSERGRATLRSTPASELDALEGESQPIDDVRLAAESAVELEVPASGAYRVRLDASGEAGELRVKVQTGDGSFATVGYDFDGQVAFVTRDADAVAGSMPDAYRQVRTARVEPTDGRIELDIVVDAASIEVFAGRGEAALTMATFGTAGERGLLLEGARGEVVVSDASLTPLRVAPVARAPERG